MVRVEMRTTKLATGRDADRLCSFKSARGLRLLQPYLLQYVSNSPSEQSESVLASYLDKSVSKLIAVFKQGELVMLVILL